jgi:hypothetical protein
LYFILAGPIIAIVRGHLVGNWHEQERSEHLRRV